MPTNENWWEELMRLLEQDLERKEREASVEMDRIIAKAKYTLANTPREVFNHRPGFDGCVCNECFKKRWEKRKAR